MMEASVAGCAFCDGAAPGVSHDGTQHAPTSVLTGGEGSVKEFVRRIEAQKLTLDLSQSVEPTKEPSPAFSARSAHVKPGTARLACLLLAAEMAADDTEDSVAVKALGEEVVRIQGLMEDVRHWEHIEAEAAANEDFAAVQMANDKVTSITCQLEEEDRSRNHVAPMIRSVLAQAGAAVQQELVMVAKSVKQLGGSLRQLLMESRGNYVATIPGAREVGHDFASSSPSLNAIPVQATSASSERNWDLAAINAFNGKTKDDVEDRWVAESRDAGSWVMATFPRAYEVSSFQFMNVGGSENQDIELKFDDGSVQLFTLQEQGDTTSVQQFTVRKVVTESVLVTVKSVYPSKRREYGAVHIAFFGDAVQATVVRYLPEFIRGKRILAPQQEADTFLVDNSELQSKNIFVAWRSSPNIDDKDEFNGRDNGICYGQFVKGELADGWLKVHISLLWKPELEALASSFVTVADAVVKKVDQCARASSRVVGQLVVNTKATLGTNAGLTVWSAALACPECNGSGKKGLFGPSGFGLLASDCSICGGSGQSVWPEETEAKEPFAHTTVSAADFGHGFPADEVRNFAATLGSQGRLEDWPDAEEDSAALPVGSTTCDVESQAFNPVKDLPSSV